MGVISVRLAGRWEVAGEVGRLAEEPEGDPGPNPGRFGVGGLSPASRFFLAYLLTQFSIFLSHASGAYLIDPTQLFIRARRGDRLFDALFCVK